MDSRERIPDHAAMAEIIETMIDRRLAGLMVAVPVKVVADSEDGHTVRLQPQIKRTMRKPDGTEEQVSYPEIPQAPITFSSGGGVTVTHPVKKDDEGWAIVSSRSLDAWHQQGGEQNPVDARTHDLSDAFYISGARTDPRKLEKYSKDSTQMRSDDGKHVVDLHPKSGITHSVDDGKHVVKLSPDGGISHTSNKAISMSVTEGGKTSTLNMTGSGIKTTGDHLEHNGANVSATHVHGGVMRGGSKTDPPDPDS